MESGSVVDSVSFNLSGDADNASPWPSSILLAEEAYVAISRNDTTASAKSRAGHTVEVTFWVADPPAVSFCTFHWSKPGISDCEDADLEVQPHVVGAQGRFILLCTRFSGDDEDEYFIYKGDPESPSLESVPLPDDDRLRIASEFGIVPRGDRGHYLLVALCDAVKMKDYILHIFSSEDRTWRTKELLNPCPGVYTITPEKVFMLQDGMLCWVDFRRGMLVCDVLQEPLHARYIPLPEPLPANRPKVEQFLPAARPSLFRDVTYADGIIKFIEIEHRFITKEIRDVPAEKLFNPRHKDVLYDSDLIMLSKHIDMDIKPKTLRSVNGWSAMAWTREVGSNCWLKGRDFDVDDILVGHSVHPASYNSQSLEFKNMYLACPTLSNANELYLKSFMKFGNSNGSACVVVVDLAENTLKAEALGGYPFGRRYAPIQQVFHLCALSNYLKRTTAIKISECEITQLGSSLKEPNNTAVCVGEPDSYESENKHLSECEITQLGSSSNEPNNTAVCVCEPGSYGSENKHISECETTQLRSSSNEPNNTAVCVGEPDSYEPENKRPRLSAKKVNYAQNEAQSLVQNVLSSQVHPEQNNMPLQHFNRWEGPGYCGNWGYTSWPHQSNTHFNRWEGPGYCGNRSYPSWPHQSNTAPPQCFNTWGEPFNPVYAPSAPGLNMHSSSNYQSLWPQPSLLGSSKQHLAGPYEAHRPCLKDWSGASYRGNSQQFPAGNSYCYGARAGNGNYNQR